MDNKSISVKKNFIYNSAFQVLILLVPFVTTPYVSSNRNGTDKSNKSIN